MEDNSELRVIRSATDPGKIIVLSGDLVAATYKPGMAHRKNDKQLVVRPGFNARVAEITGLIARFMRGGVGRPGSDKETPTGE